MMITTINLDKTPCCQLPAAEYRTDYHKTLELNDPLFVNREASIIIHISSSILPIYWALGPAGHPSRRSPIELFCHLLNSCLPLLLVVNETSASFAVRAKSSATMSTVIVAVISAHHFQRPRIGLCAPFSSFP